MALSINNKSDHVFNTAVLFLVFNRLDTTQEVFKIIQKAKPPRLYLASDGARTDKKGEVLLVEDLREYILKNIDWDCEVKTLFREENLGCKMAVSSAIDWFFDNEEEGIILEDDCLPDPTFFEFSQEMLIRFKNDRRIGMISGDNFQHGRVRNRDSYYFSKYVHIWGWATWRDRWKASYDVSIKKWPVIRGESWLEDIALNKKESKKWSEIFDLVYSKKIDTWDYQWVFANWIEGRLSVVPNVNLVCNIGFLRSDATHTRGYSPEANIPTRPILFPLNHPILTVRNVVADLNEYNVSKSRSYFLKVLHKIKSLIRVRDNGRHV
jgi:hypothetical protein